MYFPTFVTPFTTPGFGLGHGKNGSLCGRNIRKKLSLPRRPSCCRLCPLRAKLGFCRGGLAMLNNNKGTIYLMRTTLSVPGDQKWRERTGTSSQIKIHISDFYLTTQYLLKCTWFRFQIYVRVLITKHNDNILTSFIKSCKRYNRLNTAEWICWLAKIWERDHLVFLLHLNRELSCNSPIFRCLDYALNTSLIKSQDGDSVISSVAGNPNGRLLAWDFFRLHWPTLRKR